MTSGAPDPSVDALLDEFIADWHAGQAPSAAAFVARAPEGAGDELLELIAAFLELAPTVPASPQAQARLAGDPLVARLARLEDGWWEQHAPEGAAAPGAQPAQRAADVAAEPAKEPAASWGARLRAERQAAMLSLGELGAAFAKRFGLGAEEAERAPGVLERLEAGSLPPSGVSARAARALEELMGAVRGTLGPDPEPSIGGALLRADLPESTAAREQLTDLLRHLDDTLAPATDAAPARRDSLHDLLGG